jgi:NosR/NirI family nitrite reductase transcriptional regulator
MSSGLQSHRGTGWKTSGVFDRLTVVQDQVRWQPTEDRYQMQKRLALKDAPAMKEISLFSLPPQIDPTRPFTLELRAARPTCQRPFALPPRPSQSRFGRVHGKPSSRRLRWSPFC